MLTKSQVLDAIKKSLVLYKRDILDNEYSTKKYVDDAVANGGGGNVLTDSLKANYDAAYAHSTSAHAPVNAQANADITKAEIEAKLTGDITTHTHSQYLTEHQDISGKANVSGQVFTGTVEAPVVRATSYFFTPALINEGDLTSYYHRLNLGYANHDYWEFHEYGGDYRFYKNTAGTDDGKSLIANITSTGSNFVGQLKEGGVRVYSPNNKPTAADLGITIPEAYVLPIANQNTLGGIKVGAGLSITAEGVLSATGGGTADSVNWENVVGKPTFATVATTGSYNDLTDKPTIPSTDGLASTTYVDNKVAGIVNSAPETLDTLNELATALGNDANFATTVSNQIGSKVDKVDGKGLSTNDYTTTEKTKLSGIAEGAEVNQNAFSNIVVGSTTVAADSKTDTLTLVAGTNVTLTPDATNDKITIASKDTVYTHPSYTTRTGVPTADQTPAFGGTFNVSQPISDATGHITAINSRTITIPGTEATTSKAGLMSASDKSKLDGIQANTYLNKTGDTMTGALCFTEGVGFGTGTPASTITNPVEGQFYLQIISE